MGKDNSNSSNKALADFLSASADDVPASLAAKVAADVSRLLRPRTDLVFVKATLIHAAAGSTTLFICPQFGFSFGYDLGLAHWLTSFGPAGCMVGCGAVFMALSLLLCSLFLKPEEVLVLRKWKVLQVLGLSSLSMLIFWGAGAAVPVVEVLIWCLGAIVGGVVTLELGWGGRATAVRRGWL